MDARDMRGWLDDHLGQLDWNNGVTKTDLVLSVEDDEALRNIIGQYVAEGHYQTKEDVLTVIPEQAWQAAQGDTWRGGETYDIDEMNSGFMESSVVQDPPDAASGSEQSASAAAERSRTEGARQRIASTASGATAAARSRSDDARHRIGSTASGATASARSRFDQAPDLAHRATDQARSLAANPRGTLDSLSPQMIAVGLSALNEGLGQAYNGQYTKAGRFAVIGTLLSSLTGIHTWTLRDILGLNVRFGRKPRPFFILLWLASYGYNLWDAWTNAPEDR